MWKCVKIQMGVECFEFESNARNIYIYRNREVKERNRKETVERFLLGYARLRKDIRNHWRIERKRVGWELAVET